LTNLQIFSQFPISIDKYLKIDKNELNRLLKIFAKQQYYDIKKFNIMFKHTSGNCDDNYWIIGREYFNLFEESLIKMLNKKDAITHELNHYIGESNINYMYETDSNEYRYYSFTRTNNY